MHIKFVSASVLCVLLIASSVFAETLTMDEAVKLAVENNRSLEAAKSDSDAAKWGQAASISAYFPKVYFDSSVTRIDPDTYDEAKKQEQGQLQLMQALGADTSGFKSQVYEDTYSSSVAVRQPIFNGGKELAGIHAATMEKRRNQYARDDSEASTVNAVKQAYYGVLKSAALAKTAQEALTLSKETLRLTQARFDVGQVSRAEVLRWESQAAQSEGSVIEAENALRLARLNLNSVMGVELDRPWDYPDLPMELDATSVQKGQEIGNGAFPAAGDIRNHPSMREADAVVDLSKSAEYSSITNVLPNLNFVYRYSWEDNDTIELDGKDAWTASLQLEVPLFQSLGGAFGIAQSHKNLLSARSRREDAQRGFVQRKHSAQLNMLAAAQRVQSAQKEMAFSEENYRIVQSRMEVGAASNLDVLDAQFNYIQAKSRLVEAVADFRISEADWDYLSVQ